MGQLSDVSECGVPCPDLSVCVPDRPVRVSCPMCLSVVSPVLPDLSVCSGQVGAGQLSDVSECGVLCPDLSLCVPDRPVRVSCPMCLSVVFSVLTSPSVCPGQAGAGQLSDVSECGVLCPDLSVCVPDRPVRVSCPMCLSVVFSVLTSLCVSRTGRCGSAVRCV